jgi:mediator of RNA polymerase II transcription subunit 12
LELCEHLYNQGLLDRQEFLQWVLDMVEKCRYADDPLMRLVMPILMTFGKEFLQNELLSRKLAYQCAKKVTYLVNESDAMNSGSSSSAAIKSEAGGDQPPPPNSQMHPVISAFVELTNDPYSRFIILGLSSLLQMIAMDCPSALVWHYFGENKTPSSLLGSPLDHLPNCAPSGLPMPMRATNPAVRHRIRICETLIKERSKQVEDKWSVDPNSNPTGKTGSRVDKILSVLEVLDGYNFERIDSSADCLDNLYTRLFGGASSSSNGDVDDNVIVHTLCEWAVTCMRSGEHRCFVAAKLLERRQSELTYQNNPTNDNDNNEGDDKGSEADMYVQPPIGPPLFQHRLFHYLDTSAPKMDNRAEFSNLVLLFYELICHDVFSHDAYLCTLISR